MFAQMNGRQLAGWGYGIFWLGLLVETINVFFGALNPRADSTIGFWIGVVLAFGCVGCGIRMMTLIRHRPW